MAELIDVYNDLNAVSWRSVDCINDSDNSFPLSMLVLVCMSRTL